MYINDINGFLLYEPLDNIIEDILKDCVTEEICKNISNLQLSDELASVQANCDKLQNEVKDKTEAAKELTERLEKNIAETAKEANLERTARQKAEDELLELKFKTGIITEDEYYDALGIPF